MAKVRNLRKFKKGDLVGSTIKFTSTTERSALLRLENITFPRGIIETKTRDQKSLTKPAIGEVINIEDSPSRYEDETDNISGLLCQVTSPSYQTHHRTCLEVFQNSVKKEKTNSTICEASIICRLTEHYLDDSEDYLYELEKKFQRGEILQRQKEVTESARKTLINWLVKVHYAFKFNLETLYLTVSLLDNYLLRKLLPICQFQLLGISCLFVASKYEEGFPPDINDLAYLCDGACCSGDVLKMELKVLKVLDFDLGWSLPIHFLDRLLLRLSIPSQCRMESLAKYFLESTLLDVSLSSYLPSLLAASALVLAVRVVSGNEVDTKHFSKKVCDCARVSMDDIELITTELSEFMKSLKDCESSAIKKKYAHRKQNEVNYLQLF